jgi:DNA-binding response OmpR family regulator
VRPHACVIESKPHARAFPREALDDAGFIARECTTIDELAALLERQRPALVMMSVTLDGIESAYEPASLRYFPQRSRRPLQPMSPRR